MDNGLQPSSAIAPTVDVSLQGLQGAPYRVVLYPTSMGEQHWRLGFLASSSEVSAVLLLTHLRAARRAAATASAAAARVAAPLRPTAYATAALASSVRMVKATMSGEGTDDVS